ncbi:prophage PSPPH06, site-specific recombinase phage integrase family protein, partial [Pseudomonas amygdali pv. mori str. 301020]
RRVLQWGRNRGYLDSNPAQGIEAPVERKRRRLPEHLGHGSAGRP